MSRTRQTMFAVVLGTLGLIGLAVAALGAASGSVTDDQYQQRVGKLDLKSGDAVYAHAKFCYQNDLKDEAMKYALLAHSLAPDDTRPKYLVYALIASGTGVTVNPDDEGEGPPSQKAPTITDAEVAELTKAEGDKVIRGFKVVQSLLARRCGSPKCHGGGNPKAKWALALKGTDNLNMLAQNFRTVYPYLDRDNPAKSRLLAMPMRGPEVGHPQQVIRGDSDPLYKQAVTWIDTVKTDAERLWAADKK
ncbi:MAG: hypothetical protein IMZ66_10100 [Planctomycetes bacterium]|nr:hypothetical protein [Planctomycetota bacterium]